jgi:hypothetical protein
MNSPPPLPSPPPPTSCSASHPWINFRTNIGIHCRSSCGGGRGGGEREREYLFLCVFAREFLWATADGQDILYHARTLSLSLSLLPSLLPLSLPPSIPPSLPPPRSFETLVFEFVAFARLFALDLLALLFFLSPFLLVSSLPFQIFFLL